MADPDPKLLARCRRGNTAALGELYDGFGDRVYRLARVILGQDSDAEDATQEVFLRVFRHIRTFDRRGSFDRWLTQITVNTCRSLRRPKALKIQGGDALDVETADDGPPVWEVSAARELEADLRTKLEQLNPAYREVLALRELEGWSYDEIAAALEIPAGTVMSRLARARRQMAGLMGWASWPETHSKKVTP